VFDFAGVNWCLSLILQGLAAVLFCRSHWAWLAAVLFCRSHWAFDFAGVSGHLILQKSVGI
jgi:hypothetical protein